MLDVRRMRVLREVAQRGSFSSAADALAYTQSAVSQQIAALEREAGTRLVERHARGVPPGPADPEPAVAKLRAGEADLVLDITGAFRPPREDGVERVHLLDDPMYVHQPNDHPLAHKRN